MGYAPEYETRFPYEGKITIREHDIDGEKLWHWITEDNGAWGGPLHEWNSDHKTKYFKYLKKTDVVVTAGANCGMYTRLYSRVFKAVYAFEPDSLNFHVMTLNNQRNNVIKFNCALGDKAGMVALHTLDAGNAGMHEVRVPNDTFENAFVKALGSERTPQIIPTLSIDMLELPTCDLIQLDVQGYEYKCLQGAIKTIDKYKPVIILEYGQQDKRCIDFLTQNSYRFIERSGIDDIYIPN